MAAQKLTVNSGVLLPLTLCIIRYESRVSGAI